MRDSFIFYKSFYESIKELNKDDQYELYKAIMEYQFDGIETKLNGIAKAIFTLVKPQLEANNKRYENGCKGGRPKNQTKTKIKPNKNQNKTKMKPNENENVNENVNENNKKKNIKEKFYENEELNNLFLEFLEIRKKIKAVNSDRAINTLINKLSKYDDNTKYKMIEQSVVNSWKDVYELKQKKETASERLQREIREAEEEERMMRND